MEYDMQNELPPMAPLGNSAPPPLPPMSNMQPKASMMGAGGAFSRRMRQMLTTVVGGGIGLVLVIGVAQFALRPELKPTTLLATIEAQTELGVLNQKMGADAGTMLMTEAEYKSKLAEAERAGQAKAELEYQTQLAVVQAYKERIVGAYQTLYQRANMIVQAAVQLESMAQQFRQQLLQSTNGARTVIIGYHDMMCAIGEVNSCVTARNGREAMISEADELSSGNVGSRIRAMMADIPDPAALMVAKDQATNGVPVQKK
jgi:hypothetical protein